MPRMRQGLPETQATRGLRRLSSVMRVPLVNLQAQHAAIREEVTEAIHAVCEAQQFILGPRVRALEEAIAMRIRVPYGIGVSSGTDALLVTLMALGIGPSDEVLTSPYTFFSTAGSISRVGARPVFADIDPETYTLDPPRVEEVVRQRVKAGKRLRAVIPVHLFGRCTDMEPILQTAKRHELVVIEDAAQALGASADGRPAGSMGTAGCLSFFPTKNLGGFGDGGMVVTADQRLAERIRLLRTHGSHPKYYHRVIGGNFRLDELQAAVLLVKLKHLDTWNALRRERAAYYDTLFSRHHLLGQVTTPSARSREACISHQYVIRASKRDALRAYLATREIETEIYYPLPLHLQECYRDLGYREGEFPESERAARETLALPL